tara:strand:- start:652 stop:1923 length:1272 start_codon:yes stop_codon:yes gene_type:complete
MAQIRIKRSTGSTAPNSSELANAELAFTEGNDILYYGEGTSGSNAASVIKIGGSGAFMALEGAQSVAGNKTFSNNVVVSGDLTVNGTTTTLNTTNSVVKDALIELGNGTSGSPANDAGLVIERGSSNNAFIGWDESVDKFTIGTGTFTGASTGDLSLTTATLVGNLEGSVTGNCSGTSGGFTAGNASNLNSGTVPVARLADDSITEAKLDIHNSPTTGHVLKYTSNGLEWAASGAGGENNQNAFSNVAVSGQNTVEADTSTDTLNIAAGSNVTITTNNSTDTVTIASTDTNTTYSAGSGLSLGGTTFSVDTLNQDTTGNAATATALETARTIAGVSFNGTANISLNNNAITNGAGYITSSGNAATSTTATNITASANNSTDETVYLAFVDGATGSQGIETDTGLSYNPSSGLLTVGSIDGGTW